MLRMTDAVTCHVKGCDAPVMVPCESCGRPCCSDHAYRVTLVRREEPVELPGHRGQLEHVPVYTETYMLCLRCSKKPIVANHRLKVVRQS